MSKTKVVRVDSELFERLSEQTGKVKPTEVLQTALDMLHHFNKCVEVYEVGGRIFADLPSARAESLLHLIRTGDIAVPKVLLVVGTDSEIVAALRDRKPSDPNAPTPKNT